MGLETINDDFQSRERAWGLNIVPDGLPLVLLDLKRIRAEPRIVTHGGDYPRHFHAWRSGRDLEPILGDLGRDVQVWPRCRWRAVFLTPYLFRLALPIPDAQHYGVEEVLSCCARCKSPSISAMAGH